MLGELEEIHAIAAAGRGMFETNIRIGVVQSLGSYFLPLIVPDLHATHPRLGLYLREGLPDMLLQSLESGALDLLFFPLPVARSDFETVAVFREPIHVVAPCNHTIAREKDVVPEMLRGETVLSLEPGHRLYEQVRHLCADYGARLSSDYGGTSLDTLRQMVAIGMGLSLMPALYVKSEVAPQDDVVARLFRGTAPTRTIGLVWREGTARTDEYLRLAGEIGTIMRRRAPEVVVLNARRSDTPSSR